MHLAHKTGSSCVKKEPSSTRGYEAVVMMPLSERVVVGVYGISGVGKSRVLSEIAKDRFEWRCLEGSAVIKEVLDERGQPMEHFQNEMNSSEQALIRNAAIEKIMRNHGVSIVAGHDSFPSSSSSSCASNFTDVFSEGDGEMYDAIFYLEKPASVIFKQRETDNMRSRQIISVETLEKWIQHEKETLKVQCAEYGIYFEIVPAQNPETGQDLINHIVERVVAPRVQAAKQKSEEALCRSIEVEIPEADIYLLIDGDRTLCPEDTGNIFFDQIQNILGFDGKNMLKQIFERYDGYTFQAFWEVAMLYDTIVSRPEYLRLSEKIGREHVHIYSAWTDFLMNIPGCVHPILVSSSNREVWQAVLSKATKKDDGFGGHGLKRMSIIAGNNVSLHSYIVDDTAKARVAKELRRKFGGCRIFSFGDSVLDVPMFMQSDRAYIVVDDRKNRSMKKFIEKVNQPESVKPGWLYQLIDLDSDHPTAWHDGIPVGSLRKLIEELTSGTIHMVTNYALTSTSALLLASQTRRADLQGPDLQRIHEEVGKFLADKMVDDYGELMGLVCDHSFKHVTGKDFTGKAISSSNTVILPLMRGGEPMARAVYQLFSAAHFIHYYDDEQAKNGRSKQLLDVAFKSFRPGTAVNIIIIDSVINSGKSIECAIEGIVQNAKKANPNLTFTLYVLAGVMQEQAATRLPSKYPRVRFLALRVSENQYVGQGGTDTGNRLFGTWQTG